VTLPGATGWDVGKTGTLLTIDIDGVGGRNGHADHFLGKCIPDDDKSQSTHLWWSHFSLVFLGGAWAVQIIFGLTNLKI
jgi:hypothetical protein